MKRKPRPWTKDELALLGKLPDAEVAELTGCIFGTVWQKRRALSFHKPAPLSILTSPATSIPALN